MQQLQQIHMQSVVPSFYFASFSDPPECPIQHRSLARSPSEFEAPQTGLYAPALTSVLTCVSGTEATGHAPPAPALAGPGVAGEWTCAPRSIGVNTAHIPHDPCSAGATRRPHRGHDQMENDTEPEPIPCGSWVKKHAPVPVRPCVSRLLVSTGCNGDDRAVLCCPGTQAATSNHPFFIHVTHTAPTA